MCFLFMCKVTVMECCNSVTKYLPQWHMVARLTMRPIRIASFHNVADFLFLWQLLISSHMSPRLLSGMVTGIALVSTKTPSCTHWYEQVDFMNLSTLRATRHFLASGKLSNINRASILATIAYFINSGRSAIRLLSAKVLCCDGVRALYSSITPGFMPSLAAAVNLTSSPGWGVNRTLSNHSACLDRRFSFLKRVVANRCPCYYLPWVWAGVATKAYIIWDT